jgi:hypothetical protein
MLVKDVNKPMHRNLVCNSSFVAHSYMRILIVESLAPYNLNFLPCEDHVCRKFEPIYRHYLDKKDPFSASWVYSVIIVITAPYNNFFAFNNAHSETFFIHVITIGLSNAILIDGEFIKFGPIFKDL